MMEPLRQLRTTRRGVPPSLASATQMRPAAPLEKPIVAVEGIVTDSAAVIETEEPSGKMAVTGSPPLGSEPASVFKAKVAALLAWLSAILPLCRPTALARTAAARARRDPVRAVPEEELVLVREPRAPALARRVEGPGAVLPRRDFAGLARPGAGRAGGDDVAVAVGGGAGWAREVLVEDHQLHEGVERAQRLVVRDVLLGLGRDDVGQDQVGRAVHALRVHLARC